MPLVLVALCGPGIRRAPAAGTVQEFLIPSGGDFVNAVTVGPDGHVWFTAQAYIGRMTRGGVVTVFGPLRYTPFDITAGPDGNLWFTELGANRIGRITPSGGITEFNIPGGNSDGITVGPDGNLWFSEPLGNKVASVDPFHPATIHEFALPTGSPGAAMTSGPGGVTLGPDGNIWFTETRANQIGRITPAGIVNEFAIPTANSFPNRIASGPDGNLWFTETRANQIGRITPAGSISEFPIPALNGFPRDIAVGPDGNLWFTEPEANQIALIDPMTGAVTEGPIPSANSNPAGITSGPDGNIWFAEQAGNRIGRLLLTEPGAKAPWATDRKLLGPDDDGDGIPDVLDDCPDEANPDQADRDAGRRWRRLRQLSGQLQPLAGARRVLGTAGPAAESVWRGWRRACAADCSSGLPRAVAARSHRWACVPSK